MRLFSGFAIGESSLNSHGTAISAIADNISNSNTPGFKTQRSEFETMVSNSEGSMFSSPAETGSGVRAGDVSSLHMQGSLDSTGRGLDAAINGEGFFVVTNGTENFYTRAGNFTTNSDGYLSSQSGYSVLGYTAASPDTPVVIDLDNVVVTPVPTSAMTLGGNLDASSIPGPALANPLTTFNQIVASSNYSSTVSIVDSLGFEHDVALHFSNTGAGTWTVDAYINQADVGGTDGTPQSIGTSTLSFLPDGTQDPNAQAQIAFPTTWSNGSAAGNVTIDLSGMTQMAQASAVTSAVTDGVIPGTITSVEINNNGEVIANLDSGGSQTIATIALAAFPNEDGLRREGNNLFQETEDTGAISLGRPDENGRGEVDGRKLEASNVDLATEFVNLLRFQRGYQASSQVVQTVNDMVKTTLEIA